MPLPLLLLLLLLLLLELQLHDVVHAYGAKPRDVDRACTRRPLN